MAITEEQKLKIKQGFLDTCLNRSCGNIADKNNYDPFDRNYCAECNKKRIAASYSKRLAIIQGRMRFLERIRQYPTKKKFITAGFVKTHILPEFYKHEIDVLLECLAQEGKIFELETIKYSNQDKDEEIIRYTLTKLDPIEQKKIRREEKIITGIKPLPPSPPKIKRIRKKIYLFGEK